MNAAAAGAVSGGLPRPLIVRCGALGDMVLLTVLLRQLHARFGTPIDLVCSNGWVPGLLTGQEGLGEVFVIRSRRTPYWLSPRQRQLVRWLRRRGAGPTWYCDQEVGRTLLRRGGVPDDHVCDSRLFPFFPGESFTERFLRLACEAPPGLIGRLPPPVPGSDSAARLHVAPAAEAAVAAFKARRGLAGRSYLIVHPGCSQLARRHVRPRSGVSRYWPEGHWAQLLRSVRERAPAAAILLTGIAGEAPLNADIIRRAGLADVHNVAGELSVPQLVALLRGATSVISIDTGPGHVAAALGRPTVVLFGIESPVLYRPGGVSTHAVVVTGQVDGRPSILGIAPERVVAAWVSLSAQEGRPAGTAGGL